MSQDYENDITGRGSNWIVSSQWKAEEKAMADLKQAKAAAAATGQPLRRGPEQYLKRYKCFVRLNTRATNDYADRTKLAYLCNIHPNPEIQKFLGTRNARVDEDLFALNMMIQWFGVVPSEMDRIFGFGFLLGKCVACFKNGLD